VQIVFVKGNLLRDLMFLLESMYQMAPLRRWRKATHEYFLPFGGSCWSRRALVAASVRGLDEADWPAGSVLHTTRETIMQLTGCFWDQVKRMDVEPCEEHTNMRPGGDVVVQGHALVL